MLLVLLSCGGWKSRRVERRAGEFIRRQSFDMAFNYLFKALARRDLVAQALGCICRDSGCPDHNPIVAACIAVGADNSAGADRGFVFHDHAKAAVVDMEETANPGTHRRLSMSSSFAIASQSRGSTGPSSGGGS